MYGSSDLLILCATAAVLVCAGIYLSRLRFRYIALSIIGLAFFSFCLALFSLTVSSELTDLHKVILAMFIRFAVPLVFFCLSSIVTIRLAINRQHTPDNKPAASSLIDRYNSGVMAAWAELRRWFTRAENRAVCAIAWVMAMVHLYFINKPTFYLGDEGYYVPEANRILNRQALLVLEHPPLAK